MGLPEPRLTEGAMRSLQAYKWPGNIRELQHVIERAVILGRGRSLPLELRVTERHSAAQDIGTVTHSTARPTFASSSAAVMTIAQLHELEMSNYRAALNQSGGKVYGADGAAALLGIPPTTLASRSRSLGIKSG